MSRHTPHNHDRVQKSNLSRSNKYGMPKGLSFQFESFKKLQLDDVVEVVESTFEIINISVIKGGMGHKDSYLYTCVYHGYYVKAPERDSEFDLIRFDGNAVKVIDDKETLENLRVSATLC